MERADGASDFKRLKSLNERKVLRGFTADVRCFGMSLLLHIPFAVISGLQVYAAAMRSCSILRNSAIAK